MKSLSNQNVSVSSMQALVATGFQEYINALLNCGAVEGRLGEQTLLPELEPAMDIIHHVLAGAKLEIDIRVVHDPDPEIYAELEEKRRKAEAHANQLNKDVGMLYAFA